MSRPADDPRVDPDRLSPLGRAFFDSVSWNREPHRTGVVVLWLWVARRLEAGERAEAISRDLQAEVVAGGFEPGEPVTSAAQAFARGLVVQVASDRSRRPDHHRE